MTHISHAKRLAALLILTIWAVGCSGDLGDFCHSDDDCLADLRCSALPEQRGVCVYPEGGIYPTDATVDAIADAGTDSGDAEGPSDGFFDLGEDSASSADATGTDAGALDGTTATDDAR